MIAEPKRSRWWFSTKPAPHPAVSERSCWIQLGLNLDAVYARAYAG